MMSMLTISLKIKLLVISYLILKIITQVKIELNEIKGHSLIDGSSTLLNVHKHKELKLMYRISQYAYYPVDVDIVKFQFTCNELIINVFN